MVSTPYSLKVHLSNSWGYGNCWQNVSGKDGWGVKESWIAGFQRSGHLVVSPLNGLLQHIPAVVPKATLFSTHMENSPFISQFSISAHLILRTVNVTRDHQLYIHSLSQTHSGVHCAQAPREIIPHACLLIACWLPHRWAQFSNMVAQEGSQESRAWVSGWHCAW